MKLGIISDTHGWDFFGTMGGLAFWEGDLFIHAGDATNFGSPKEWEKFLSLMTQAKDRFRHVVFVPGNHDFSVPIPKLEALGVNVLIQEEAVIDGLRLWGAPYTPAYGNWAFQYYSEADGAKIWDRIPDKLDILITHPPALGVLDSVPTPLGDRHLGCGALSRVVLEKKPLLHVHGHIHESAGVHRGEDTTTVNAFKPILLDFFFDRRKGQGNEPDTHPDGIPLDLDRTDRLS